MDVNNLGVIDFSDQYFNELLKMAAQLWEEYDLEELSKIMKDVVRSNKNRVLIVPNSEHKAIAFSIFSIRVDHVEGAVQSPTGYLEGIFVEEDYRNKGIARALIAKGEQWCKSQGCVQMGSDTWISDKRSRAFHKSVGFWEEEEVVHFLKNIN